MAEPSIAPEVIVWTDARRTALAQAILAAMGQHVRLIGAGGPRGGDGAEIAQAQGLSACDDLRKLLIEHPPAYMLLATEEPADVKLLQTAMHQGTAILTLEPVASSFDKLIAPKAPQGAGCIISLPSFTFSPAWLKAGDMQDILGPVQLMSFESLGSATEQSLHARLAEAWEVLGCFAPVPETINCVLTGPRQEIPQDPRDLAGHLTAQARLSSNCMATITLSDQLAHHQRRLLVVGQTGRLLISDLAYELYGQDDQLLEHVQLAEQLPSLIPTSGPDDWPLFAMLAAAQWRQVINQPERNWLGHSRHDQADNLACQLTCLLSARTSQPENPVRMKSLASM